MSNKRGAIPKPSTTKSARIRAHYFANETTIPASLYEPPPTPSYQLGPENIDYGENLNQPTAVEEESKKQESLIEWFDRSVENELKIRRDEITGSPRAPVITTTGTEKRQLPETQALLDQLSEASASGIEIASQMLKKPDTDLTIAVEQLAKAEAMCAFAEAVKAAEAAADAAPPDRAEEAAAAGARKFQTSIDAKQVINQQIPGERPIEVIGYVGITSPKYPKKP